MLMGAFYGVSTGGPTWNSNFLFFFKHLGKFFTCFTSNTQFSPEFLSLADK